MRATVLSILAACAGPSGGSAPSPERVPISPLVGPFLVGAPWPVPYSPETRPALVKVQTTFDGAPITVELSVACGGSVAGLTADRIFYAGDDAPLLEPEALQREDPVGEVIAIAKRWVQSSERQGFVIQGQFGGSIDALQQMTAALQAKRDRGETVGLKDLPEQKLDRSRLEATPARFMIVAKHDQLTRMIAVSRTGNEATVELTEGLEACPSGPKLADPSLAEVVLRR